MAAFQAVGQVAVIDSVCVNSTRKYRIDGEEKSTYQWVLYDDLTGSTVSLTNPSGTRFDETIPVEKHGSEIEITWNQPGTFRLEAIQYSGFGCDTLRQGLINVFDHPEILPGIPDLVCAGQPIPITGTTVFNYSLLKWETSGDGTFTGGDTLTPTYTPGPNDLLAGTVTLTIRAEGLGDPASCTEAVGTVTITISNIQLAITPTDPLCFDGADGKIKADVTGAFGALVYAWTGPNGYSGNQAEITGLTAGVYSLTVTDEKGCTATGTITLNEPPQLLVSVSGLPPKCYGGADGEATVTASGGTGTYTYSWSDPASQTTSTATGLASGVYTVTVTDASGCIASASITIGQPAELVASIIKDDVNCFGGNDGSATVSVTGGTATYTYQWDDPAAQKTATAIGLLAGVYRVTVTDANGCFTSETVTIDQPQLLIATISRDDVKCFGGNDGSATVSVSGGTATYTYLWSDPLAQKTATATGLANGTYTVTVTDAQGCQASASVTITQPAQLIASVSGNPAKCFGSSDGTASVTVTGGTAPYSYLWNDPSAQTTDVATGLAAGIYTVTVTDQNNCQTTATVTITQPTPIVIAETHIDSKCSGSKPGSIDITVTGGTPGYTYSWAGTNGFTATTEDLTGLAGTVSYTITVTDANGCTASSNIFIDEEKNMTLAETHENIKCFGGADGSINLDVKGGKSPFAFVWLNMKDLGSTIATTEDVTGLVAGSYRVTVTDDNGCTETLETTLTEPLLLVATAASNPAACFGGSTGSATVTVSGGTPGYSYKWNDPLGQTTSTATGLSVGVYTVTVTDVNGCTTSASINVDQPTLLAATVSGTSVKCFGGNDGTATVVASGGTAPYTYLWNDFSGQTGSTASGLIAGTYSVTVTDANGCTTSGTVVITEPTLLQATVAGVNVKCFGGNDGSATVSVSGGTLPYAFQWNDVAAQTTQTASGLKAGTYQVTVTDGNGCTRTASVTITEPPLLTASIDGGNVKCFGGNDGTATVNVSGGVTPYSYLWDDPSGQTSATASNLLPGTYHATVTDANGCITTATITITQPAAPLALSITSADVKCHSGNDGSATVSVTGGTSPYTYLWNDLAGQTTATASGLIAGTFTVVVTDQNGCTASAAVTVAEPSALMASTSKTDLKCFGGNDGTASVTVSGGISPYNYLWNDPAAQTTSTATGLTAGTWQVLITDANGCTLTASVTLNEPAASVTASVTKTDARCWGSSDGTATVLASGGTGSYTYSWNDPAVQNTAIATGLKAGTYQVTVTDANGCSTSATVTIAEPPLLTASATGTDAKCFGSSDGTATVAALGGTPGFLYLWNDPALQTTATATGLKAGTYQVIVTDTNGCTATASVSIGEPPLLTASITSTNVNCNGGSDGTATVSVSGGTVSYTYLWNDPAAQTTATATGLKAGVYQVTVTDANACTLTASVTISEPVSPLLLAIAGADVTCFGGNNGSATVTVSGGTSPYIYLWNDPSAQNIATAINLKAGIYEVSITDANGCAATQTITIKEPPQLIATASSTDVSCYGGNDGSATVLASGGTASYTYLWNDPLSQTTATVVGLTAGTYTVQVFDANGCVASATVTVKQPDAELIALASGTDVSCFGSNDGTATVIASGGTTPYAYVWSDLAVQTTATASGLKAGTYTVTVTDAKGCTTSASVTITEPPVLMASATGTDVKCFGGNDGTAMVIASGGTTSYTYLWSDPASQTTVTATGLKAGIYQVTVTDAHGCTATASVTINEPAQALSASVSSANVKCFGGNDGTATVIASGGTATYTYSWNDPASQTTATANGLKAGVYQVTVTDANGCTTSASVTITEPPLLTASIAGTDVKCFGGSDGSATVTALGGTPGYNYLWNDLSGQTAATATNLKAGTYQVVVADANGCLATATVTISEPTLLTASATGTDVKCFGGNDGTATVAVSGGTASYTYLWNDSSAQTTATAINLRAGNYLVIVTDAHGCTASASVTITEPALPLSASTTSIAVKCFGGNDGSATVSVSGGTASYTYLWNDQAAQTSATASNLKAGVYEVLITDAHGCTLTASVTVTEPASDLLAVVSAVDVKCFGGNDGSATVVVSGGTSPYGYLWNDAATQTGATASNLIAGTYQVIVTDANGCTTSASVTVKEPAAPLLATATGVDVKCFGGSDGTATVAVSGGTVSYTYLWNDPAAQNTATATNLKTGTYTVVVTDANGCTTSASVFIEEPDLLVVVTSGSDVKCFGGSDGTATASVSGVTLPYTYLWNDQATQSTPIATGLKAGIYQVTVTDINGCSTIASVTIGQPAQPLAVTVSAINVKCFGGNDGSATASVSGGTATYTYLWSDPMAQTSATAVNLTAGTYQVLVTDANGCTLTSSISITEPAASLSAFVVGTDVKCFGGSDGKATVSVLGGTPAYAYLWNDLAAQTTATATGLVAGVYTVTVTDFNGCSTSASVSISQPASIPTSTTDRIVCESLLPFKWNGNDYTAGGTYSVTLTTKLGCDSIAVLNLQIEIPKLPVFATIGPLCKNSVAPALPVASTNSFTGTWSPSVISTAVSGTFTYTFTPDAGQCATTATMTIEITEPIVPEFAAIGPLCINTVAPVLPSLSTNGIPGTWSPAAISTTATGTTVYTFTPDAGQCATTASMTIEVTQPLAYAGPAVTICPDSPYTLAGATAQNYSSLLWTTSGDGTFNDAALLNPVYTPGANDMVSGTVTLTITAQGSGAGSVCVPAVSSVTITIIRINASVAPSDVTCYGANDGTIVITDFTGGSGSYEYRVDGFGWQTKSQYLNLAPGIYQVDMRDVLIPACVRLLATITIKEPKPLTANAEPQDATCLGNDGTISIINPDGGSGSYEYSMNGGAWTTSGYFAGLVPGNYHLEMRDLNVTYCMKNLGFVTIAMPMPITAKVGKKDVSCYSGSDGQIIITEPLNGSGVYEFNIGAGWSSQMVFNNLTAGSYSVQMRDFNAKACVQDLGTVTIGEPAPLSATLSHKDISCYGAKDGSITIQDPVGGSGSYEFTIDGTTWTGTTTYTNLLPGEYYVLMRDKNAPICVRPFPVIEIIEPLPLAATITKSDITCNGAHDGIIMITDPMNGTPGYEYTIDGTTWLPTTLFAGLGTNTYTVQMRDANGCKETIGTVFIVEPKPLIAVVNHTDETCVGNDGSISITKPQNSESGLYEFTIDGGSTWTSTGLFTGLTSNTYTVKMRDASLATCEQPLGNIHIDAPIPLAATASPTNVDCYGANNGFITVKNPTGGSGVYEYSVDGTTWTNTTTLANLTPSVYVLQMRDAKATACLFEVGTYTITQPGQLAATASPTDVTCYGGNDGAISLSAASGGSGSFEYSVDGVNWFANKIDNLKAGLYTVQMRDAAVHSCVVSLGQVEIKEPEKITADVTSTPVTCFGANDGTITINNTQNGIPPYQYSLNGVAPWQSSNVFTGVKPGTYDLIVVSDANNCVSTLAIVTITEPEKLEAKASNTNETVPGANDGTITISGQKGGSGTFEYSKDGTTWQPGDTFTGLAPATYTIWVRDANSITCTITLTVPILPAGSITAQYNYTPVTCFGGLDGSITFKNPNGAASYQYSVDGGASWQSSPSFNGLAAKSYTLVIRDANNTPNTNTLATIQITQPDQLEAVVTATSETFAGAKDGAITISSPKGGSGAYQYSIDGISWQASEQFPGLGSGIYNVQIRDANATACRITIPKAIQPAGALIADVTQANVLCNGGNTGSILFSNASGATVIEFSIDNGVTWNNTGVFNGLAAGDYEAVIRDANNIINKVSLGKVKVTEPTKLLAVFGNFVPPKCAGQTGSFSISAIGGTPPYSGIGDFVLQSGVSRTYIISDRNGCVERISVSMPDPPKIVATAVINSPKCFGENGTIVISATGGTGALSGIGTFIVQAGKAYSFKVTDANGCSSNIISGIMPPTEVLAVQITPVSSLCLGGNASVTVTATGGTPPYVSGTGTFNVAIGTHTFTVVDSGGCMATASITISVKDPPATPVAVVSVQPTCTVPFGTIQINSPLGLNYLYSLDGGTYTSVTTFDKLLPESSHTIKVKDSSTGCESLPASVIIGKIPLPPLAPIVSLQNPTCLVATGSMVVDSPLGNNYRYSLDGGTYTSATIFTNLAAGSTHTLTVLDVLTGCVSTPVGKIIDLLPANPPTPSATVTVNPTCDNPDGTIVVNTPKGAEYEYTIAGKTQTSTTFTDLVTGTYSITVRSIKTGCVSVGSVAVPAIPPSPVITSVSKVNPKCYGETYTITMTMTNTPPGNYTIRYDGGQFNNVAIAGGTATITGQLTESFKVFNNLTFVANGCTSSPTGVSVRIDNPSPMVFQTIFVTEHVLKATQKGAIDINVTGGTGSLKYVWSNGATTQDLNDISYGTYTVTITDANGCQIDKSIKIPLNNPPIALPDNYMFSCSIVTGDLLANDYDPDPAEQKDFITINVTPIVSPKNAAQFKINTDGTFEYDAKPGFAGIDVFVYEIADKWGQTASATVTIEVVADFDGDGIADLLDPDADGDGILNIVEGGLKDDTDGDGHPNWLDIDSDNDGIVDNIEAQTSPGYAPPSGDDTDKDGIDDTYDTDQGGLALTPVDTDLTLTAEPDKIPDFLDADSDNDLVPDYIEGHDQNADGKPDRKLAGKDTDADGLDDAYDDVVNGCNNGNAIGAVASLQDFDGDGMKDWRDENDDDDEYLTRFEDLNVDGDFSNDDTDFDGYPEYLDFGRDCDILIPDAFSPNDDNIHDYFQIYCMNHYPNAKMYIFDQLGNKLFEKENYGNMDFWGTADRAWWDGRTTNRSADTVNGKVIPGTYYYVLNLGNGEVKKSYVFVSY